MAIILSGGGKPEQTKELDKFYLSLLPRKCKILYIPIAKKTRPFNECYEWLKSSFTDIGFKGEIVMWTDVSNKTIKDIEKFDSIYIGGGNTYSLLMDFKKLGFLEILKEIYKKGVLIYGSSAGAMIFGKDIFFSKDLGDINDVSLQDTSALNIINGYGIWPHYIPKHDKKINELKKGMVSIIAIPEGVGLYLLENIMTVKGEGKVRLFNKKDKKEFKKNEKFSLIKDK